MENNKQQTKTESSEHSHGSTEFPINSFSQIGLDVGFGFYGGHTNKQAPK